jgi:hypothetical protein
MISDNIIYYTRVYRSDYDVLAYDIDTGTTETFLGGPTNDKLQSISGSTYLWEKDQMIYIHRDNKSYEFLPLSGRDITQVELLNDDMMAWIENNNQVWLGKWEPINHPPVLNPIGLKSVKPGSLLSFNISATDQDRDTLAFSAEALPVGATINPTTGEFKWIPTQNQVDQDYDVTFVVTDEGGLTDGETATIQVRSTSGGTACLIDGTLITMADGSLKPIEEVRIGDSVRSYSTMNKLFMPSKVTQTFKHYVGVTSNHPMLVNGKWLEAGEVQIGDWLLNSDRVLERVNSIEAVYGNKLSVYNLEVDGTHTYIANNVVVHNKDQKPSAIVDEESRF